MNPDPLNPAAPAPKKARKTWLIVVIILLVLCALCCLAAVLGGGFYYYLQPAEVQSMLPTEIIPFLPPQDSAPAGSSPAEAGENPGANLLETIQTQGFVPIPLKITTDPGIRVVEQMAFLAPDQDEPELCILYLLVILESDKPTLQVGLNYSIWVSDTEAQGKSSLFETANSKRTWAVIPTGQQGAFTLKKSGFRTALHPSRMEMTISLLDAAPEYNRILQKISDPTLPNPLFTPLSAEISATQQDSSGLWAITAAGRVRNNLPVKNYINGIFVFYDDNGQPTAFAPTQWKGSDTGVLEPGAEGDLSGVVPYAMSAKPARVVLYTLVDSGNMSNLTNIK